MPAVYVGAALVWALFPLSLPAAFVVDRMRDRSSVLRAWWVLGTWLTADSLGLAAAAALWLPWRLGRMTTERYVAANRRLRRLWVAGLKRFAMGAFGVRFVVEGQEALQPTPFLLLVRHSSLADTLVPPLVVEADGRVDLRTIVKRELIWEPCIDVVGPRVGVAFVQRGGDDPETERTRVRALADDLAPQEAVLVYPEGTRFTPAKQAARRAAALEAADPDALAREERYDRVLPPKAGGVLRLLAAMPDADVVFLAHSGLETAAEARDLLDGTAVGIEVRVRMWRVPRSEIPITDDGQRAWLDRAWERMDAEVKALEAAGAATARSDDVGQGIVHGS